ncbi:MAG: VanW family protein [Clostridia bacterium]|nr:VanW family protein [Clostridia bacterium]
MNEKKRMKQLDDEDYDVVIASDRNKKAADEKPYRSRSKRTKQPAQPIPEKTKKLLIGLSIGCGAFLLLFILAFVLLAGRLNGDKVYKGVTLNGQSVSGLTAVELQEYIYTRYVRPLENAQVVLEIDAQRKTYAAKDILNMPDTTEVAREIYYTGRTGSALSRLFRIYELAEEPENFTISYTVNSEKFEEILAMTGSQQYITKLDPSFKVEEDRIIFTYGRDGLEINAESLEETFETFALELSENFAQQEVAPGGQFTVKVEPKKTLFRRILKVHILNAIVRGSTDATFEKLSSKELEIIPEIINKYVDEALLDEVLARVNAGDSREETTEEFLLPDDLVIFTEEFYGHVLFRDTLGASSNVNSYEMGMQGEDASQARAHNIRLVVDALDGIILLPGERFSFREMLGEIPTSDFVAAFESYMGFDEPILGGGVSHVSSALYSALCTANVSVEEVQHYTYYPVFGTLGFDAYINVSEQQDLVFTNPYAFPIRIDAAYSGRTVRVKVQGTIYREWDFEGIEKEDIPVTIQPESTVELSNEIISTVNYKSITVKDPSLPAGASSVTVTGITGRTVELYITTTITTEDGEVETKHLIDQVTYQVRDERITVGTGT